MGIKQAMLYVDDDNEAGKGLYKTLGFDWHFRASVILDQTYKIPIHQKRTRDL
jgi:ribosomal protein S18 acetylase RimI-like enzyme